MNITDSEEKIALVEALLAEGKVSFRDALKLLAEAYPVSIPTVWPAQPWDVTCGWNELTTTAGGGKY